MRLQTFLSGASKRLLSGEHEASEVVQWLWTAFFTESQEELACSYLESLQVSHYYSL